MESKRKTHKAKVSWTELLTDRVNQEIVLEDPPEDSKSLVELSEFWNCSYRVAHNRAMKMVKDKLLQRHMVRGTSRPVPYYTMGEEA
jgi:hypothetical protein